MKNLKIGLDVDEVLFDCINYALEYSKSTNIECLDYSKSDITDWSMSSLPKELREKIYQTFNTPEFYIFQPVLQGAVKMVRKLQQHGHDIIFCSAVPPSCMGKRGDRLREVFPFVPKENIMLGSRKDLLALDVMVDDNADNIKNSIAKKAILFSQPWNLEETLIERASNYQQLMKLIEIEERG